MHSEFSLIVNIYRDVAYLCTSVHFNVWITLMFRIIRGVLSVMSHESVDCLLRKWVGTIST